MLLLKTCGASSGRPRTLHPHPTPTVVSFWPMTPGKLL